MAYPVTDSDSGPVAGELGFDRPTPPTAGEEVRLNKLDNPANASLKKLFPGDQNRITALRRNPLQLNRYFTNKGFRPFTTPGGDTFYTNGRGTVVDPNEPMIGPELLQQVPAGAIQAGATIAGELSPIPGGAAIGAAAGSVGADTYQNWLAHKFGADIPILPTPKQAAVSAAIGGGTEGALRYGVPAALGLRHLERGAQAAGEKAAGEAAQGAEKAALQAGESTESGRAKIQRQLQSLHEQGQRKAAQAQSRAESRAVKRTIQQQQIADIQDAVGLTPDQVNKLHALPLEVQTQRIEALRRSVSGAVKQMERDYGKAIDAAMPDRSTEIPSTLTEQGNWVGPLQEESRAIRSEIEKRGMPLKQATGARALLDDMARAGRSGKVAPVRASELYAQAFGTEPTELGGNEYIEEGGKLKPLKAPKPKFITVAKLQEWRTRAIGLLDSPDSTNRTVARMVLRDVDKKIVDAGGLDEEGKQALRNAQLNYRQLMDTYGHEFTNAISGSSNPKQVADTIFGNLTSRGRTDDQQALLLARHLKRYDPQGFELTRQALADKIITEGILPAKLKVNPEVLKEFFPGQFQKIDTWIQARNGVTRFEDVAKASPLYQKTFQDELSRELQKPEYIQLAQKAQALQKQLAQMPSSLQAVQIALHQSRTPDEMRTFAQREFLRHPSKTAFEENWRQWFLHNLAWAGPLWVAMGGVYWPVRLGLMAGVGGSLAVVRGALRASLEHPRTSDIMAAALMDYGKRADLGPLIRGVAKSIAAASTAVAVPKIKSKTQPYMQPQEAPNAP